MKTTLIAPCGMNCNICIGHLREKNKCPGCRKMDKSKPKYCRKCIILNCKTLKKNKMIFCSDKCKKYPCKRLKDLDKRYKTKYKMSMIENLEFIKKHGIRQFTKNQEKKYKCKKCSGTICIHRGYCLDCK